MRKSSVSFRCQAPVRAAFLLVLLASPGLSQAQAILASDVIEPRTFGYVVGDRIQREVRLRVASDYRLDAASLPKAGRLDRWLEVAAPDIRVESTRNGRSYRVLLTYQIFNAPRTLETVTLPQQDLRIVGEAQTLTTPVPALRVTVAPVTSEIAADRLSGSSLQPDRMPAPLPVEARQLRLAWTGTALAVLLLFATWRRALQALQARRRLPFARAVRELKPLQSNAPADYAAKLKIVHDAVNKTAGRAIFGHNLDQFFAAHPEFAGLRADFERLFAASGRIFFADAAAGAPEVSTSLLRLCQRCSRIERRSFEREPE